MAPMGMGQGGPPPEAMMAPGTGAMMTPPMGPDGTFAGGPPTPPMDGG